MLTIDAYDETTLSDKRSENYANTDRERLNTVAESLRLRQGNNGSRSDVIEDGRKSSENDRRYNSAIRSEGTVTDQDIAKIGMMLTGELKPEYRDRFTPEGDLKEEYKVHTSK